ncbi:MAG: ABC transporter ATP-binding protein [Actinomycetota bacterium]
MNLLELTGLTKRFGDVTALDRAGLTVAAGEVVGLFGANGAGKTTLIKVALGLLWPTSGDVRLLGEAPSRAGRRRIGYVPQGLGLYEDLTVGENLSFVARAFGVSAGRSGHVERDRLVGDLSLGDRRRVAFDAALLHSPELLVLDEPTSGVGLLGRTQLWDRIRSAAEQGSGVLVTSHHMNEAQECDRVVLMAAGRVIAEGSVAELIAGSKVVEVRAEDWAGVFTALDAGGLTVGLRGRSVRVTDGGSPTVQAVLDSSGLSARISVEPATFEETFVALTKAH